MDPLLNKEFSSFYMIDIIDIISLYSACIGGVLLFLSFIITQHGKW